MQVSFLETSFFSFWGSVLQGLLLPRRMKLLVSLARSSSLKGWCSSGLDSCCMWYTSSGIIDRKLRLSGVWSCVGIPLWNHLGLKLFHGINDYFLNNFLNFSYENGFKFSSNSHGVNFNTPYFSSKLYLSSAVSNVLEKRPGSSLLWFKIFLLFEWLIPP